MSDRANASSNANMAGTGIEILVVESKTADARLFELAFEEAGLTNGLHFVDDGADALLYVRGEGKYANVPPPDVIFLDLFLPKVDGLTVLKEIKSTPSLRHIPVVVASNSDNPADVRAVYDLNGNCYIRKPNQLSQFLDVIETSYHFWGSLVTLRPKGSMAAGSGMSA